MVKDSPSFRFRRSPRSRGPAPNKEHAIVGHSGWTKTRSLEGYYAQFPKKGQMSLRESIEMLFSLRGLSIVFEVTNMDEWPG